MKISKTRKANKCDAMRCKATDDLEVFADGVKLCARHASEYSEEHGAAPAEAGWEPVPPKPNGDGNAAILAMLEPLKAEAESTAAQLVGFVINNAETLELAGAMLREGKAKSKALEKQRTDITGPMLAAKKGVDGLFKPTIERLAKVEHLLKQAVNTYAAELQTAKVAALTAGDHATAIATPDVELPQGFSQRTLWRFRVTDPAAVPRLYLCVDAAAIQAHVNEHKGATKIPGVEVYSETSAAVRA